MPASVRIRSLVTVRDFFSLATCYAGSIGRCRPRAEVPFRKIPSEPRSKMNIRRAATEDLERIVQLFEQLGYASGVEQVKNHFHALRQSASGEAFVAQEGRNIVGVAVVHIVKPLHVRDSWALLSALVVDGECRSSGVGTSLLAAAEVFALQHGCSQLELASSSARTRAHMFYERNGYQEKRLRFVKILA